jgi:DNA damage-binding protein 1
VDTTELASLWCFPLVLRGTHTSHFSGWHVQGVLDVPIFGRISVLKLFRPRGEATDLIFLLTERYKFCVLQYDAASGEAPDGGYARYARGVVGGGGAHPCARAHWQALPSMWYNLLTCASETHAGELVTRANGDASDRVGRPCDAGQLGIIDPDCRMIGLHLYDGHLKIIPIGDNGALQEAFNVRLEELKVLDVAFLHGCAAPTLSVLYEDTKEQRHIRTYEVSLRDKVRLLPLWSPTTSHAY